MKRERQAPLLTERLLRQLEQERRRRQNRQSDLRQDMVELNVLRAFGAAVGERLEVGAILEAAKTFLPKLFEYSILNILIDLEDHPQLYCYATASISPALFHESKNALLKTYGHIRGAPLDDSEVRLVMDGPLEGRRRTPKDRGQLKSHVTLPLVSGGENVGCISISSRRADAFGALDVQLFSLISYQLSAAFRNALLLRQTWEQAIRDPLTGLFNRRHFTERLEEEHRRAVRYRHPISLVLSDLDFFKQINDSLGHQAGDRVLVGVAKALQKGLRDTDILCRYGGEEFAVILPEASVEEAVLVAERLRLLVTAECAKEVDLGEPVHMSFGVAGTTAGDRASTVEDLVSKTDSALYLAKQGGRNKVCASLASGAMATDKRIADIEKRRFPRISAQLPMRYLVVPDLGDAAPSGQTEDVSTDGLRLVVDRAVPEGAFVLFELDEAGNEGPVRMLSKVVWAKPRDDGKSEIGTRILSFEKTSEARFQNLIQKKLKDARKPPKRPRKG